MASVSLGIARTHRFHKLTLPKPQRLAVVDALFVIILILLPFGRVFDFPLVSSSIKTAPLAPIDIAIGLAVTALLVRKLSNHETIKAPTARWAATFIIWAIVSLTVNAFYYGLSPSQILFSSLYLVRWLEYAALYLVAIESCRTVYAARRSLLILLAGGTAFAVFGICQSALLPNFPFILHPEARPSIDYDLQGHRLVSTILDPNIASGYLAPLALLALGLYRSGAKRWLTPFLLMAAALVLTLSRGGLLGFAVGLLGMLFGRKGHRVLFGIAVVAAVCACMFPFVQTMIVAHHRLTISDVSAMSRLADWKLAWGIIRANPVFGVGFNTLGMVLPLYGFRRVGGSAFGLEGDLLLLPVLSGIVGLLLYVCILVRFLRTSSILGRAPTAWLSGTGNGARAGLIAAIFSSLFTSVLLYPHIMAIFWTVLALVEMGQKTSRLCRPVGSPQITTSPN